MTDELVTRLRNLGINLADRAADRIEADAATIARLLNEAFEWRYKALESFNRATKASQDAEAAEAKVAALVEACHNALASGLPEVVADALRTAIAKAEGKW